MVLQSDYRSLCWTSSSISNKSYSIVKLKCQLRQEDGEFRGSKFHHRGFLHSALAGTPRRDLHGNPDGGKARKKSSELFRAIPFVRCESHYPSSPILVLECADFLPRSRPWRVHTWRDPKAHSPVKGIARRKPNEVGPLGGFKGLQKKGLQFSCASRGTAPSHAETLCLSQPCVACPRF